MSRNYIIVAIALVAATIPAHAQTLSANDKPCTLSDKEFEAVIKELEDMRVPNPQKITPVWIDAIDGAIRQAREWRAMCPNFRR